MAVFATRAGGRGARDAGDPFVLNGVVQPLGHPRVERDPRRRLRCVSAPATSPPSANGGDELDAVAAPEPPGVVPARGPALREQAHVLVGRGDELGAVDRLERRRAAEAAGDPLPREAGVVGNGRPSKRSITSISRSSWWRSIVPSSWRTQARWR